MATQYEIKIFSPVGLQLAEVPDWVGLQLARKVGDVGTLTLTLPFRYLPYLTTDTVLEVYRQPDGGGLALVMESRWMVRRMKRYLSETGELLIQLTAFDGVSLLKRRIIAYVAGSSQAAKTAAADDMIKTIVKENLGASASDANRIVPSSYFSVAANLTAAPSQTKAFAWRNTMLEVLQEIAQASTLAGTYLTFDVVALAGGAWELRTYTGQRGVDHRWPGGFIPVIFDPALGNVSNLSLTDDWVDEKTYVYALGQGDGAARTSAPAYDNTRIAVSPFGRIETARDSRNTADSGGLQAEANSYLRECRQKRIFDAQLRDTPNSVYGVNFDLGDQVTGNFFGETIDCRIEVISITKDKYDEAETIVAKVQSLT
jgi:hypothetical protein